jgi:hypothetical protein
MTNGCRLIPVQFRNFPARFKKFPVLLLREFDCKFAAMTFLILSELPVNQY